MTAVPSRFRSIPREVEAMFYNGHNAQAIRWWTDRHHPGLEIFRLVTPPIEYADGSGHTAEVWTLHEWVYVQPMTWIVRNINAPCDWWPVAEDTFKESYERIGD